MEKVLFLHKVSKTPPKGKNWPFKMNTIVWINGPFLPLEGVLEAQNRTESHKTICIHTIETRTQLMVKNIPFKTPLINPRDLTFKHQNARSKNDYYTNVCYKNTYIFKKHMYQICQKCMKQIYSIEVLW